MVGSPRQWPKWHRPRTSPRPQRERERERESHVTSYKGSIFYRERERESHVTSYKGSIFLIKVCYKVVLKVIARYPLTTIFLKFFWQFFCFIYSFISIAWCFFFSFLQLNKHESLVNIYHIFNMQKQQNVAIIDWQQAKSIKRPMFFLHINPYNYESRMRITHLSTKNHGKYVPWEKWLIWWQ